MNKLEDFIRNNKDGFDEYEPSQALFHRIEKRLAEKQKPKAKIISFNYIKWAAAATAVITTGILFYFLKSQQSNNTSITTAQNIPDTETKANSGYTVTANDTATSSTAMYADSAEEAIPYTTNAAKGRVKINRSPSNDEVSATNTENALLIRYAQIINGQQQQMQALRAKNPELYDRFSNDLGALERNYHDLKARLDSGFNSEKLLEAMILNLKMQSDLLSRQLIISRNLKDSNKKNEKAFNL